MHALDAMILRGSGSGGGKPPAAFLPHKPEAKQRLFLDLPDFEALYGGAAGGGKTDALLMGAAEFVNVPGYAALILRRTYPDLLLPDGILTRAKEWWEGRPDVHWSDKDKTFTFPSGATITFGYCDTNADRFRYQGAAVQFLGVDELTQWPELWYRYLLSRVRKPKGMPVPLRARSTSNPGGIGHEWVRRRFVDEKTRKAPFVPANLDDNPHLDAASYRESLARLDSTTRKQLEEGVWIRDGAGLVYEGFSEARNLIEQLPELTPGTSWTRLLAQDYGTTNATSWVIWAWREHDTTAYMERAWKKRGVIPSENAEIVKALSKELRFTRMVGDIGGLGKAYIEEARRRFHVPIEAADKENKLGFIKLMNGDMERGQIKVVRAGCAEWIEEALTLPWNEARTKEAEGFENHCTDGGLYGWRAATAFCAAPPEDKPKTEIEYWERQDREDYERTIARNQRATDVWEEQADDYFRDDQPIAR